jgi:flagellar export protein FliJ
MSNALPYRGLEQIARHHRDTCSKQLVALQRELAALEVQRRDLELQRAAIDETRRQASRGLVDMQRLIAAERIRSALGIEATELERAICRVQGLLETSRSELLQAQQSLKSYELLQEKHRVREERAQAQREQRSLDEWSQHPATRQVR